MELQLYSEYRVWDSRLALSAPGSETIEIRFEDEL